MIKPTIHLNGDRPETLREQYREAYEKLGEALPEVCESFGMKWPNKSRLATV